MSSRRCVGALVAAIVGSGGVARADPPALVLPAELRAPERSMARPAGAERSEPEPESASIRGVVTDANSRARISGALVILGCACLEEWRETMTDADGVYGFRDLPAGLYTVQVLYGSANVSKTMGLPARARFRAHFTVDPRPRVRGRFLPFAHDSRSPRRSLFDDRCPEWMWGRDRPECLSELPVAVRVTHLR